MPFYMLQSRYRYQARRRRAIRNARHNFGPVGYVVKPRFWEPATLHSLKGAFADGYHGEFGIRNPELLMYVMSIYTRDAKPVARDDYRPVRKMTAYYFHTQIRE